MSRERVEGPINALAVLVALAVFVLCLPATLYRGAMWVLEMVPQALVRKMPPMSWFVVFIWDCFFIVAFIGRPICAIALVLDVVLLFLRGIPIWLKLLASAFVVLAVLGTLLVESQAAAGRH